MRPKVSIAHIINPVNAAPPSDLRTAQPITFETMRRARDFASGRVDIHLLTAQFDEDSAIVPPDFVLTKNLTRSVLDIESFEHPRKLPLIKDILNNAIDESSARFIVYSNVDIALMPHFYETLGRLIETGVDAATINRRTLPAEPADVEDLPLMYSDLGERHPGWDCFLFDREAYSSYVLGTVCIGAVPVGAVLRANLLRFSRRYVDLSDHHLTFHLGKEQRWRDRRFDDYQRHNLEQHDEILTQLGDGLAEEHPFRQWQAQQLRRSQRMGSRTRSGKWLRRARAKLYSPR